MSKDLQEVTRLINLYIEGAGKGNADKLNEAFHSSARWFGTCLLYTSDAADE